MSLSDNVNPFGPFGDKTISQAEHEAVHKQYEERIRTAVSGLKSIIEDVPCDTMLDFAAQHIADFAIPFLGAAVHTLAKLAVLGELQKKAEARNDASLKRLYGMDSAGPIV